MTTLRRSPRLDKTVSPLSPRRYTAVINCSGLDYEDLLFSEFCKSDFFTNFCCSDMDHARLFECPCCVEQKKVITYCNMHISHDGNDYYSGADCKYSYMCAHCYSEGWRGNGLDEDAILQYTNINGLD